MVGGCKKVKYFFLHIMLKIALLENNFELMYRSEFTSQDINIVLPVIVSRSKDPIQQSAPRSIGFGAKVSKSGGRAGARA